VKMSHFHALGLPPPLPLLPVTSTWALPITLYYLSLSIRVAYQRKESQVIMSDRLPDSKDLRFDPLHTAIRAQANFLEYVPLALTLAAVAEVNGAEKERLSWALGFLLAIRIAHVELGLLWKGTQGWGRHLGYWGSLAWLAGAAGWGAWLGRRFSLH